MSKSWFGSNLENFDSAESDFKRLATRLAPCSARLSSYFDCSGQLLLFFGAPPQERLVGDRETNVRHELPQLVDTQGFCEDVGHLKARVDVL